MLDFPNSPTTGQIFTAPNGDAWAWDGAKWVAAAPQSIYLPLAGGTMAGALTLAANPAAALQASTKQYVDNAVAPTLGLPGRNVLINGAFDIWQRGTSFANPASALYLADRWLTGYDGSGSTFTVAIITPVQQAYQDAGFSRALTYSISAGGTGGTYRGLSQRVEGVRTFAGQTVTMSGWVWGAALPVSFFLQQNFGTGGSPSASLNTALQTFTPSASTAQRFSATFTLPTINGKTLGTNGDDCLVFSIALPLNTAFILNMGGFQLEAGAVATLFDMRSQQQEFSLCQRYYQAVNFQINGYGGAGGGWAMNLMYPVRMRASPTVQVNVGTQTNCSATTVLTAGSQAFQPSTTITALGNFISAGNANMSAEL